jgi:hypothetical protein
VSIPRDDVLAFCSAATSRRISRELRRMDDPTEIKKRFRKELRAVLRPDPARAEGAAAARPLVPIRRHPVQARIQP